jgi:hypothetical protein
MPKQRGQRPQRPPVQPDRIRSTKGGFAFVPNRFLHAGFFASLTHSQRSLYFFLVLAGDRNGVSYYSYDRICTTLEISLDDYIAARNALIDQDLLAFDGSCFQVLSLPPRPVVRARRPQVTREDREHSNPATIEQIIRSTFGKS